MEHLYGRILENIFGPSVDNVNAMLKMLSRTTTEDYKLRVILKNKDVTVGNTTLPVINMVKNFDLTLREKYDKVISNVYTHISTRYTTFEHNIRQNTTTAIVSVASLQTPHYNIETGSFVRLNMFKTVPTVMYNTNVSLGYERRIGEIYEFTDPKLSNWYVNMNSFIKSNDYFDPRLRMKTSSFEHYDGLFIEFGLKSVTSAIVSDVVNLLELFYTQNYADTSITFIRFNMFYGISSDLIPTTTVLTQSDITGDIEQYRFIHTKFSRSCIIITFENYVYKLSESTFECIYRSEKRSNDLMNAFICKYEDDTLYEIVDCIVCAGRQMTSQSYDERMKNVTTSELLEAVNVKIKHTEAFDCWEDVAGSFVCIGEDINRHYTIQTQEDASLYLLARRIPYSYKYCLYVTAKGKDVINSTLFFNNYSKSHFNYTLTSAHNDGTKYAVFDTPYFDTFISDLILITDEVLKGMHPSVRTLIDNIINGTVDINQKVCKFTCVNHNGKYYWVPIAIMNNVPASEYKFAMYVASSMYDSISFVTPLEDHRYSTDFSVVQSILNRFTVEHFINKYPHENIMEIFNDKHNLITELFSLSLAKNVIAVNENSHNIIKYVDLALQSRSQKQIQPLLLTTALNTSSTSLSVKMLRYDMTKVHYDLRHELLKLSVFNTNCCDYIIVENNVNGIFGNIINMFKFCDLVKFVLKNNGRLLLKIENMNNVVDQPVNDFRCSTFMYKFDKYITKVGNELRFKGVSYRMISGYTSAFPLYVNIVYSGVRMPCLPYDKGTLKKLAHMFAIDIHFNTTLMHRIVKSYVGITPSDRAFGALPENNYDDKMLMIADEVLSDVALKEVYRRASSELPLLVVSSDSRLCGVDKLVNIGEKLWITHVKHYERLTNIDVLKYARSYIYDEKKGFQAPFLSIFYEIMPMFNITLDEVIEPFTHNFIVNYLKSIEVSLSPTEKNILKGFCVASFTFRL
jgi:hypothetical protein